MFKALSLAAIFAVLVFLFIVWVLVSSLVGAFTSYVWNPPTELIAYGLLLSPLLIGVFAVAFVLRREEND